MTFNFIAKKRERGNAEEIREQGQLPGVLYGPEIESVPVAVDYLTFEKLYEEAGESSLVDFQLEGEKGEPTKVLIQDVQIDPVKRRFVHFDLRQIKMGVEMNATISLNFIGESQAVKEGGTLNTGLDSINIKCLPKDLVSEVDVDLSKLETYDNAIHVKDVKLPEGITVTDNEDNLVAKVTPPLTEEQLKAMEESSSEASVPEVEGEEGVEEGVEEKEEKKEEEKEDGGEKKE